MYVHHLTRATTLRRPARVGEITPPSTRMRGYLPRMDSADVRYVCCDKIMRTIIRLLKLKTGKKRKAMQIDHLIILKGQHYVLFHRVRYPLHRDWTLYKYALALLYCYVHLLCRTACRTKHQCN